MPCAGLGAGIQVKGVRSLRLSKSAVDTQDSKRQRDEEEKGGGAGKPKQKEEMGREGLWR